jgi:two-component system NtrC family sensor kinase
MSKLKTFINVPAPNGFNTGLSLQVKVAVLVAGVYALFIGLSLLGLDRFVLPSFQRLEQKAAREDLARVVQALQREQDFLLTTASDWAVWTETWKFLGGAGPEYETNNLTPGALAALNVDVLALYDAAGRPVWTGGLVEDDGALGVPPALGPDPLPAGHPLVATGDLDQVRSGLLITDRGPMLLGMHAVTTNEGTGPVRGSVVFGRYLDEEAIHRLANQAGVDLEIQPLPAGEARQASTQATRIETTESTTNIRHLLADMHGTPVLAAHLSLPRTTSNQGRRAIRLALTAQTVSGLLATLFLLLTLGHLVVKPLQRLAAHAVRLGRTGQPSPLFSLERRDELGVLSYELNQLMGVLADTRRRLLEQSYDSGRAEMAGGILHNIGNSITPLAVQADQLRQEIHGVPVEDMGLALAELERADLPADRRRDVQDFARLALSEMKQSLERAEGSRHLIAQQITHISRILGEQERHSRAGHTQEPVRLDLLLQEAVELLGDVPRERLEIRLDPDLARFGECQLARVALQQVVINLMINAAEAVAQAGLTRGLLVVKGVLEDHKVRLDFTDNGCGFSAEQAERLFQRGYSTKSKGRSSGLGLHWSSNTLHALGGWLGATSPGPGLGATFSLSLPWRESSGSMGRDQRIQTQHPAGEVVS